MPVLIVADLHLDLWLSVDRDPFQAVDPTIWSSLDVLIVAGDLSNKPKVRWPHMIRHLARYISPERIHLLPGNHDYYDHVLDGDDRLAKICADSGVHFAQKTEVVVNNTRLLCCTLWTDFALHDDPPGAMKDAQRDMNDYRYIRLGSAAYRRIRPSETAAIHADHVSWLEERLAVPFAGRTVVATHHCPHPDLIGAERLATDPAYGSNMTDMIEKHQPTSWVFGHTHYQAAAKVGTTSLLNVSLGYPEQVSSGREAVTLLRGLLNEEGFGST